MESRTKDGDYNVTDYDYRLKVIYIIRQGKTLCRRLIP